MYIQYHICVPIENDNMKNLMVISEFKFIGAGSQTCLPVFENLLRLNVRRMHLFCDFTITKTDIASLVV